MVNQIFFMLLVKFDFLINVIEKKLNIEADIEFCFRYLYVILFKNVIIITDLIII
jgi:hypothetical protein